MLYREHISSWGAAGLFQSPLLREGRRGGLKTKIGKKSYFNSRPSAMGDERGCGIDVLARVISIHAPPRGATCAVSMAAIFTCSISIHAPPRGATLKAVLKDATGQISIHAPPRGATKITAIDPIPDRISIHAPPRGATGGYRWVATRFRISIHAPPRGATIAGRSALYHLINFNSRPSARGDGYIRDENGK